MLQSLQHIIFWLRLFSKGYNFMENTVFIIQLYSGSSSFINISNITSLLELPLYELFSLT